MHRAPPPTKLRNILRVASGCRDHPFLRTPDRHRPRRRINTVAAAPAPAPFYVRAPVYARDTWVWRGRPRRPRWPPPRRNVTPPTAPRPDRFAIRTRSVGHSETAPSRAEGRTPHIVRRIRSIDWIMYHMSKTVVRQTVLRGFGLRCVSRFSKHRLPSSAVVSWEFNRPAGGPFRLVPFPIGSGRRLFRTFVEVEPFWFTKRTFSRAMTDVEPFLFARRTVRTSVAVEHARSRTTVHRTRHAFVRPR